MRVRSRLAVGIFYAGLALTAALIIAAAGAMFRHGLHYEGVFWLLGWSLVLGFLWGATEMARREREVA